MIKNKSKKREQIFRTINAEFGAWKDSLYYGLSNLINEDAIFSKLPYMLENRGKTDSFDNQLNFLKNVFVLPTLFLVKLFLIKIERTYCRVKNPHTYVLQDIKSEKFDYLFVLNTLDHTITALPVLESMDNKAKCLVVTFREVYVRYKNDLDKLKNTKIIFFDYELKNLPPAKYLKIFGESKNKYDTLKSQHIAPEIKQLIELDKNFIKYHLKTELVQYYFFEKVFNTFDIKGAVSIVFSTAFELCKEREIPTFVLQHGIGGKGHGHPYVSDHWFTFDDISKNQLDDWLDNTVNVIPSGSPRFEYLKEHLDLKIDIVAFNKKIGNSSNKRLVTYVAGGYGTQQMYSALKDFIKALPSNVILIIKLHPRVNLNVFDLKGELERILKPNELKNIIFIKYEVDFYEILAYSDIIITHASTGMLESIAVDIPTIQVGYFTSYCYPDVYNLASYGWKYPINDPDILIDEVLSILSDKKKYEAVIEKQKWLKNKMFKNFGSCGKVIADTIMEICEQKERN